MAQFDESFARMVAEHHFQLRGFVRSLGVDPEWVDDIAQEVFLTALREQKSFDQTRDLGKWLRGIARNLVRNEVRRNARRKRLLHEGMTELLLGPPDADCETREWQLSRMPALRDCVEQLPPRSRQMVSERYGGGWTSSELAEHLGMTAVAVRQSLLRIRRQLKGCIEQKTAEV